VRFWFRTGGVFPKRSSSSLHLLHAGNRIGGWDRARPVGGLTTRGPAAPCRASEPAVRAAPGQPVWGGEGPRPGCWPAMRLGAAMCVGPGAMRGRKQGLHRRRRAGAGGQGATPQTLEIKENKEQEWRSSLEETTSPEPRRKPSIDGDSKV
jgi:hypothetical protein